MMSTIHIFRAGTHQPMDGEPINFTANDLAATAKAYNPALHEAPLVIGHPQHDDPAWGWVKSVEVTADGLEIVPHEVDSDFAALVEAKRYKKVSASFYDPNSPINPVPGVYYLRHVGFLGAQPPSLKGLKTVDLADSQKGILFFSETINQEDSTMEKGFMAGLYEFLKTKLGNDEAAKIIKEDDIATIDAAIETAAPELAKTVLPKDGEVDEVLPEVVTQLAAVSEENLELKNENEELRAQLEEKKVEDDTADFAETLRRKVKPCYRPAMRALLKSLSASGTGKLEFSENGKSKPLAPAFKAFIQSLPDVVSFSEEARKNTVNKNNTTVNPLIADAERRAKK